MSPDENIRRLLDASKTIHASKLVQIMGYKTLIHKAKDERVKRLLNSVVAEEQRIAEFWAKRIRELGDDVDAESLLSGLKSKILMRVLGTKGFFEWALVDEFEGIQTLAIQAEQIKDVSLSETWSRFATDEKMHLEKIRTQVLGMEAWEIRGGSGVRDMVNIFSGANGGLLSTLAFVTGTSGAFMDMNIVLVTGLAGLIAGSISSAAGAFQSTKSEVDVVVRKSYREEVKGQKIQGERDKLIEFYQSEGYSREASLALIKRIEERQSPFKTGTLEELGLAPKEIGSPFKTGLYNGASFGLAAIVPILPFAFKSLGISMAIILSVLVTLASLFVIGSLKTIFSRKKWVRSGLMQVVFGASIFAVTYLIGKRLLLLV